MVSQRTKELLVGAGLAHCIAALARTFLIDIRCYRVSKQRIALQLIEIESEFEWPPSERVLH